MLPKLPIDIEQNVLHLRDIEELVFDLSFHDTS